MSENKSREGLDVKYIMKAVSELYLERFKYNQVPIKKFLKDDVNRHLNYPTTKSVRNLDLDAE